MKRSNTTILSNTLQSLERMQKMDPNSIQRVELGVAFNFVDAVPFVQDLIILYKQLNTTILEDIPDNRLNSIKQKADADYNLINEFIAFTPKQQDPTTAHDGLINRIKQSYATTFDTLHPYISYSISKSADFKRLEMEARAMIQSVKDKADQMNEDLFRNKEQADNILQEIRKVAAEQGVSQQAIYFKEMAEQHEGQSEIWQDKIIWTSLGLGLYALLSIFIHKIPFLKPEDTYQTIQLGISKILIFGVISFYLYLSAKNYLSHKHNSIINKHRQSSLMTFNALVEAAKSDNSKDIILNHAASCIFSPQSTGYNSDIRNESPTSKSVIELLSKPFSSDK